jgi:hypothetical protein
MSKRTSEANKAISEAWANEKQLVLQGKGTRNWAPEQQRDILTKGKAYGEDGKAFEGHHMKSAEAYPECQGKADNIEFLSRSEHCIAHNGDFRNSTNGYYNPHTGQTKDFGEGEYEPCKAKNLSEPIKNNEEEKTVGKISSQLKQFRNENGEPGTTSPAAHEHNATPETERDSVREKVRDMQNEKENKLEQDND